MSSRTTDLTTYAKFLRNASPREFDAFVNVFETYTGDVVADVVAAAPDSVLLAQGGARHLQKVLQVMKDCDKKPTP